MWFTSHLYFIGFIYFIVKKILFEALYLKWHSSERRSDTLKCPLLLQTIAAKMGKEKWDKEERPFYYHWYYNSKFYIIYAEKILKDLIAKLQTVPID